jgi:hypothetical protein
MESLIQVCEEAPPLLDDQGMLPVHLTCCDGTIGFPQSMRIKDRKGRTSHDMFATSRSAFYRMGRSGRQWGFPKVPISVVVFVEEVDNRLFPHRLATRNKYDGLLYHRAVAAHAMVIPFRFLPPDRSRVDVSCRARLGWWPACMVGGAVLNGRRLLLFSDQRLARSIDRPSTALLVRTCDDQSRSRPCAFVSSLMRSSQKCGAIRYADQYE